jgi:hypothetical protein
VFQSQGFSRQRFTIEILLLVVGLYAFECRPRKAAVCTAVAACVVAPAALIQAGVLPPLGIALTVMASGALWFVALARGRRAPRGRASLWQAWGGARANGGSGG